MITQLTGFTAHFTLGQPNPHIYEEYIVQNVFDIPYMSNKFDIPCSRKSGNDIVNSLFGKVRFEKQDNKNEVTLEEFEEHYIFGKYPNVRGWISHLYEATGKLLTKRKLFEYLLN